MDNKIKRPGLHLFKLAGFEVRLDLSWIFLAALVTWTLAVGYFPFYFPDLSTVTYWSMGIIGAIGLFLSIILHELCHSLVGRYYGIQIEGITLFIFGGVAEMSDMPPNPKAEFMIAIVGPLFSIALGLGFYFLYQLSTYANWPTSVRGVIHYLFVINLIVGAFNLLPAFPLDGGRVFRSILWWWKDDIKWATSVASSGCAVLGFVIIFFGIIQLMHGAIISGLWMFLMGFFMQHISRTSYKELLVKEIFSGEKIREFSTQNPVVVKPGITIQEFVDQHFYRYYHKLYPVVKQDKIVGSISFKEIKQINMEKWPSLKVEEVMEKRLENIITDANTAVPKVLKNMQRNRVTRMIITDNGKLYGMISLKDLMDIISVRMDFETD